MKQVPKRHVDYLSPRNLGLNLPIEKRTYILFGLTHQYTVGMAQLKFNDCCPLLGQLLILHVVLTWALRMSFYYLGCFQVDLDRK